MRLRKLGRWLGDRRVRWALGGIALIVATAAAANLSGSGGPSAFDDLERGQEAGSDAQDQSARITENLQTIAENLEAGADLTSDSKEIEGLTKRQQASLEELAALLRDQLASTERTARALRGTRASSIAVAELGERQAAAVEETLRALRRLQVLAADASETSADLALQALYGAALAEDTQEAFSSR